MKRGRTAPKARSTTKRQKTTFVNKRQQQIVKPIIERKYFDALRTGTALTASTIDWAGSLLDPSALNCLFAPVQGDDIFNRQGRKVQVLQIKVSGQIGCNPQTEVVPAPDVACIVRLHLVQDTLTNGTALLPQNVFGNTFGNGEPTDQFQNTAFFGRFKVLKSLKFILQNPNMIWTGVNLQQQGLAHIFKMNVKFKKPAVVHYHSTNLGTIADVVDNSFHIMGLCNDADLVPLIAYISRTTFIDV